MICKMIHKNFLVIRDSLLFFRKETKARGGTIDRHTYYKIAAMFCKFIMKKVKEGYEVALPHGFGTLQILGFKETLRVVNGKIVGRNVDWVVTKQMWEKFPDQVNKVLYYYDNTATNGYVYKVKWSRRNVNINNKWFYTFVLTKDNKSEISQLIRDGKEYLLI